MTGAVLSPWAEAFGQPAPRFAPEKAAAYYPPAKTGMSGSMGREQAEHFVENWRAMVVVCQKGEMRQGYCRGRKP